jgi:transposase
MIKRSYREVNMETRIIGIDLAVTAQHKAVVLDQGRNEFVGPVYQFGTQPAELEKLLSRARAGVSGPVKLVAVLEATGMVWYPVAVYLDRQGVLVYRLNGRMTADLRQVYWRHASSDCIDGRVLTRLYQLAPERLHRLKPPSGDHLALQRACRELDRWRQLIIGTKNRLLAYDQLAWNGLSQLMPGSARAWVRQQWYDPWQVCQAEPADLAAAWQAVAPDQSPETAWIKPWLARAKLMTQLYGSPDFLNYPALQQTVRRELERLAQAEEATHQLKLTLIRPLYRKLHPSRVLDSLVGVGQDSAAVYLAFIQDIDRFPSIAQFRNWTGIVPYSHQSGQFQASGQHITQAGPDLVKCTLYLNANTARLWDPQIAKIYHTQVLKYGKHHNQALCACASHLANRLYAVLKRGKPYVLRDVDGTTLTKSQARQICQETYHVPDEIRTRNNARVRKARAEQRTERQWLKRQL